MVLYRAFFFLGTNRIDDMNLCTAKIGLYNEVHNNL